MLLRQPLEVIVMLVPVLLFSLTVHEFSHAAVATALGDPTAKRAGRLTLNPIAHLDPFGTILLFLIGFGYAKPVPVDLRHFRRPRRDDTLVALAGPGSNLAVAVVIGLALRFTLPLAAGAPQGALVRSAVEMGFMALQINLLLAVFNILPIYPLDGSHVVENSLPPEKAMRFRETSRWSMFIFLAIVFVPGLFDTLFAPARYLARLLVGY